MLPEYRVLDVLRLALDCVVRKLCSIAGLVLSVILCTDSNINIYFFVKRIVFGGAARLSGLALQHL